jgi:hypothetical protein
MSKKTSATKKSSINKTGTKWTTKEVIYLVNSLGFVSTSKIAKSLNRTVKAVNRKVENMGYSRAVV